MLKLCITKGEHRGSNFVLDAKASPISVGRSETCDISILDGGLSREHALIEHKDKAWIVKDRNSTNGTFVNGLRVTMARITPGDTLVFGHAAAVIVDEQVTDEDTQAIGALDRDQTGQLNPMTAVAQTILGESDAVKNLLQEIADIAPVNVTVLVQGETGTGKELVARAIHNASGRETNEFVAVNCGAIPEHLIESEFFGHEKGAFTGAQGSRKGYVADADGGTLFLDEVGELPLATQSSFLRFLEDKTIQRLGARDAVRVDTRVVAATNRDLRTDIEEGSFRSDLYHRLKVAHIVVPPLRDRQSDVPLLVNHYRDMLAVALNKPFVEISTSAMDRLCNYSWPGNIRELRHALELAIIKARGDKIEADHLNLDLSPATPGQSPEGGGTLADTERDQIVAVLGETNGNKSLTAKKLGISRTSLYEKMRRYGIS